MYNINCIIAPNILSGYTVTAETDPMLQCLSYIYDIDL